MHNFHPIKIYLVGRPMTISAQLIQTIIISHQIYCLGCSALRCGNLDDDERWARKHDGNRDESKKQRKS